MKKLRKISKEYYVRQIVSCWLVFYMLFCFGMPVQVAMADPNPAADALPSGIIDSTGINAPVISGLNMDITQTLNEAIVNWNNFDIGANAGVEFHQPGVTAAVLNRVHDGDVTGIMGRLTANGRVFIINPAGIVFGKTAVINVAQLVASSLNIADDDFMKGVYKFSGEGGMVSNYGQITAEQVALIGRKVLNAGVIQAPAGTVIMAAGDKVYLGAEGSDVVVEVTGVTLPEATDAEFKDGDVINEGTIEAAGGKIVLAAGDTWSRAVEGLDEPTVAVDGGTGRVGQFGTINADGVEGDGGSITLTAGEVVALGSDSVTTANAGTNGDGGDIITYSPDTAIFASGAQVEAKGGSESGDGGFFELSGKEYVEIFGNIDLTSADGQAGNFLIDPRNILIDNGGDEEGWFQWSTDTWHPDPDPGPSELDVDRLEWYLNNSNVTVSTAGGGSEDGWIKLDAGKDLDYGGENNLTLRADDYIEIYSGIDFHGSGDVTLKADNRIDVYATHVHKPGGDFKNTYGIYLNGGTLTMNSGRDGGGEKIRLFDDIKAGNIMLKDNVVLKGTGGDKNQELVATGTLTAKGNVNKTSAGNLVMAGNSGIKLGGDVETTDGDLKFEDAVIANRVGNQLFNANADGTQLIAKSTITKNTSGNLTLQGGRLNAADDTEIDIRLGGDVAVNQGSLIIGLDGSDDDTRVKAGVTLSARDNVTVKDSLKGNGALSLDAGINLNLHKGVTAVGSLSLVAGNEINSDGVISVTGSDLVMQQGVSLDTANYLFANQGNTDLTLVSTGGSVSATAAAGNNAANKWQSIGAHANQNITLAQNGSSDKVGNGNFKQTIHLGDSGTAGRSLWAENGYIDIDGFSVKTAGGFDGWSVEAGDYVDMYVIHEIKLDGDVTSGDYMSLFADRDERFGSHVWVKGLVDSGGTTDIEGMNVFLDSGAVSEGDMTIIAHGLYGIDNSPEEYLQYSGDVRAGGKLESKTGKIEIIAVRATGHPSEDLTDSSYNHLDPTEEPYLNMNIDDYANEYTGSILVKDVEAGTSVDMDAGHDIVADEVVAGTTLTAEADRHITLNENAQSGGDMKLHADFDGDNVGDMIAMGNLESTGGSIDIYADDDTIHLENDYVKAHDDVTLHNNTIADDGVLIKAGDNVRTYGTLTGDGDLTVEAGDNILFGDDAGDYVDVEDTLIAKAGLDNPWYFPLPSWSEGSIEAAGDVTAGDMQLIAGAGLPGFSDSHVEIDGKLTTTKGGMIVEAHHDITLHGDVDSDGDMVLNADRHRDWWTPDHMLGGDVLTEGTVDADGTIDMYGNNITLEKDVTSGGDMTLTADTSHEFPPSEPQGDVYAQGNLESTGGSIDIYADDDTIHLENDYVKAHDDVTLHNNTIADDGVLIKAGDNVRTYGTLTGDGDLTVEAGDNILFGDDAGDYVDVEDTLIARAGLDIPSSWCPPSWSEGFIEAAGDITAADMLLTAGWGWPGYEVSTPTQTYVSVAGMLTSTAGDITVGAQHDIVLGGKDVDGTWTSVDAAGNLTLDGDWHSPLYGDGYKGGDVYVAGAINTGGSTNAYGNNITLGGDVQAGGDIILTAGTSSDFADPLPEGDVTAHGNLTSGGSIEIYSDGDTTYLGGDVLAAVDVLLNNNTEFTSTDDQHVTAQTGSVTANGYLEKPEDGSLYLLANDDISLADHVLVENGGISIIAETGKIFTPGAGGGDDTLNVDITGTSDHVLDIGVDLPKDYDQPAPAAAGEYETGKAAIVIMSEKALKLGPDGTLTARGTYYDDGSVDDRPGVDFANYDRPGKPGGDPIDVAIYLASNSRELIDLPTFDYEGDVHVGSPVFGLPDGAVMVVDAYDRVTFGDAFETSLDNGNVDWLEVCSRISPTYEFAWAYDKLPKSAGEGWDLDNYVWRGEGGGDDGGAWVLEPALLAPAPAALFAPVAPLVPYEVPTIEGCPELTLAVAMELGITPETIQVGIGNALALNPTIQPCEACAKLIDAAAILRDEDGSRMAAMVQVFNEVAPPDMPPTDEMFASIATAFEGAAEGTQYASAMEYVDAFVQYVAVLDIELGSPVGDDSVAFVMGKHGAGITENENANIGAFVATRLEGLETFGG